MLNAPGVGGAGLAATRWPVCHTRRATRNVRVTISSDCGAPSPAVQSWMAFACTTCVTPTQVSAPVVALGLPVIGKLLGHYPIGDHATVRTFGQRPAETRVRNDCRANFRSFGRGAEAICKSCRAEGLNTWEARSKESRKRPPGRGRVAAMLRRIGERANSRSRDRRAAMREQIVRETFGAEAGSLLRALPPEDRNRWRPSMFQRIKDGRMNIDDTASWLLIRVRQRQQALEQAASRAAGINAAQRSRGGKASSAARRERWQPWQHWVNSQPFPDGPKFQRDIVSVIQARALGRPDEDLERKRGVPANLPVIHGQNGKPPSERSIRQHLFGAK